MTNLTCPERPAHCALCGARHTATLYELDAVGWDWWTDPTGHNLEVCPACQRERGGEYERLRQGTSRR